MFLHEDKNWVSVRVGERIILPKDVQWYPAIIWHELLYHIEVEPINGSHRYQQITK